MKVSEFVEAATALGMVIAESVSNSTHIVSETEFVTFYDDIRNITRRIRFALFRDYFDYSYTIECVDTYEDGSEFTIDSYSFGFGNSRAYMMSKSFAAYQNFDIWYPIVNEYERTISELLRKCCNSGDKISVKTDTTDAVSLYTVPNRFGGFDYVAHHVYNNMKEKYSHAIIGVSRHEGSIQFVYDSSTMEEWNDACDSYMSAKAEWCQKYGCE